MLELFPEKVRERIEKEGSLDKLVSAFLNLAQDMMESGEADQILKKESDLVVSAPVFMTDTGK